MYSIKLIILLYPKNIFEKVLVWEILLCGSTITMEWTHWGCRWRRWPTNTRVFVNILE